MDQKTPETIDEYIASFPEDIRIILTEIRQAIRSAAPLALEKISWGMATFTQHGNLVHFAGQKSHVGFYPTPSAIEAFAGEIAAYRHSKGAVQFPYSKPLPIELIQNMVRFRVAEQEKHWKA